MKLSNFGEKFSGTSSIKQLMNDLGEANQNPSSDLCMLGGGNPAIIPEAQTVFNQEMLHLMKGDQFQNMLGLYDGPQGEQRFIEVLCDFLNKEYAWGISTRNIVLTNGSQNSFFYLFNALSGKMPDGRMKRVLFPIAPEYVGYADLGLSTDQFCSIKPCIKLHPNQQFKYHVDFESLEIGNDIAAICLSRPTNPTGNVISDYEIKQLDKLARQHNIPLIIDNAYGQPFPNVMHVANNLSWNDHTILCMSLSKLGLPGARTGIIIANEDIVNTISSISSIITLAPNSIGAALMTRLIQSNEITHLTNDVIRPFYHNKVSQAVSFFNDLFAHLPVRIHKPEGAFFLWLWMEGLPISSSELYERLKQQSVLVIPGEAFFIGLPQSWQHTKQCIRINYAQPEEKLHRGLSIIAQELEKLYSES